MSRYTDHLLKQASVAWLTSPGTGVKWHRRNYQDNTTKQIVLNCQNMVSRVENATLFHLRCR